MRPDNQAQAARSERRALSLEAPIADGDAAEIRLESAGTKANQTFAGWISLADATQELRLP